MPSWASLLAAARPIPLVPPVISAVDALRVIGNSPFWLLHTRIPRRTAAGRWLFQCGSSSWPGATPSKRRSRGPRTGGGGRPTGAISATASRIVPRKYLSRESAADLVHPAERAKAERREEHFAERRKESGSCTWGTRSGVA